MPVSDHRTPPTLEDLLRLKRAERPSQEFWNRFEKELREKQLAALLHHRSWWHEFPRLVLNRRAFMPIGAVAILTVAMMSSRFQDTANSIVPADHPATSAEVPTITVSTEQPASLGVSTDTLSSQAEVPEIGAKVDEQVSVLSSELPERAGEIIPWIALDAQSVSKAMFLESTLETAENPLGRPNVLAVSNGFDLPTLNLSQPEPARATVELASVSEQNSKRSRLLAQMSDRQFAPDPRAPANVRERLVRRLADTGIPDHITRIGLKGDQVSLRF
jgi:hypothetical protein